MRTYLAEKKLDYFLNGGYSNLTKKHYEIRLTKDYTYSLRRIISVKNQSLRLYFSVRPTFSDGKKSSREGNLKPTQIYDVQIQFDKAFKYLAPYQKEGEEVTLEELYLLGKKNVKKFWEDVVDNCDLRFYSNDPSFYWQGFWEDLSNQRAAIKPFKGKHGTGRWRKIHQDSGNLLNGKLRVTKHIAQILLDLDNYENKILMLLCKGPMDVVQGVGEK